jgi:hypothetical protein
MDMDSVELSVGKVDIDSNIVNEYKLFKRRLRTRQQTDWMVHG